MVRVLVQVVYAAVLIIVRMGVESDRSFDVRRLDRGVTSAWPNGSAAEGAILAVWITLEIAAISFVIGEVALATFGACLARREFIVRMCSSVVGSLDSGPFVELIADFFWFHWPRFSSYRGDDLMVVLSSPLLRAFGERRPIKHE